MKIIKLREEPVELYKILKFEGICITGGEAKALISEGEITVNGKVEKRKRRKILAGDMINFNHEKYLIKKQ